MTPAKKLSNIADLRNQTEKDKAPKKEPSKDKKGFPWNLPWKMIALGFIILLLVINGIFAYGLYALGWNNKATRIFVKIFPYPAATLKGGWVRISSYYNDLESYEKYYEVAQKTDFKSEDGQKIFKALKDDALSQLVQQKIIEQEAKKSNIKVEKNEVEDRYKKLAEENGEDTLKKQIKEYYGWTIGEFKEKIRIVILKGKLEEKISKDEVLNKDKKNKAEEILTRIKNGEDFAKLAKEFSEDPSAADGGNLGWFEKGKMVQEFENAAFALKPGEVSGIVRTQYGYHIIKVNDKKDNEISASHILIKSISFEDWLKQKESEYKVKRLLNLDKIKS